MKPWLIACERSGKVRDAMLKRGIDAISCDVEESDATGPHILGCLEDVIGGGEEWEGIIAFPPCTYLTNSAEWAYGDGPYHQKVRPETLTGLKRREAREYALSFVRMILSRNCKKIGLENPVGAISTRIRAYDQWVQPYQFGHDASKKTCLWLKGLALLTPTKYVEPRMVMDKGKLRPRWGNQTDSGQNKLSPSDDRATVRGYTYQGIAEAMANQWGSL